MLNGERFRREMNQSADTLDRGVDAPLAGKANAARVRMWGKIGEEAIDAADAAQATRYLLAMLVNLTDQQAMVIQSTIGLHALKLRQALLVPLWIAAVALVFIAFK